MVAGMGWAQCLSGEAVVRALDEVDRRMRREWWAAARRALDPVVVRAGICELRSDGRMAVRPGKAAAMREMNELVRQDLRRAHERLRTEAKAQRWEIASEAAMAVRMEISQREAAQGPAGRYAAEKAWFRSRKRAQPEDVFPYARAAIEAGRYEEAEAALRKEREQIVARAEFQSRDLDLLHRITLLQGLGQLRRKNVTAARESLARAFEWGTVSSPRMGLAAELLKAGERQAVLAFFDQIAGADGAVLASLVHKELPAWRAAVQRGETPDFGSWRTNEW